MFQRFTDRARRVVVLAQEQARSLNHNYIGTEHVLLGLVAESEGYAAQALRSMGVTLELVREQVDELVGPGSETSKGHIPFTPRSKKILELSLREAVALDCSYIGTEHVLLGLIREGEGVAVKILTRLGVDLGKLRDRIMSLATIEPPSPEEAEMAGAMDAVLDAFRAADFPWRDFGSRWIDIEVGDAVFRLVFRKGPRQPEPES